VARHIAESERFGEVRGGYRADLVLLRANPLVDVANTRRLNGVMVRGRWMPTEAITQLRQALTAQFR
jgi:imidazolonepropionase-like amidohydrolase